MTPAIDQPLGEARRRLQLHAVGVPQKPFEVHEDARPDGPDALEAAEIAQSQVASQLGIVHESLHEPVAFRLDVAEKHRRRTGDEALEADEADPELESARLPTPPGDEQVVHPLQYLDLVELALAVIGERGEQLSLIDGLCRPLDLPSGTLLAKERASLLTYAGLEQTCLCERRNRSLVEVRCGDPVETLVEERLERRGLKAIEHDPFLRHPHERVQKDAGSDVRERHVDAA